MKIVPHTIDYNFLSRIDTFSKRILYVSAFFAIVTLVIDLTRVLADYNEFLQLILNSITCLLAVSYFIADIAFTYFFQAAEIKRRKDFFDNSLGTHLSEKNSVGYYSNEAIPKSIIKLGLNCFENSLFTKKIASRMLKPQLLKMVLVILGFLSLALFTNNKTLTTVIQLALPLTIIQQTIKLYFFRNKIEKIYDEFCLIFSATKGNHQQNLIISNVINYESILAWGSILLDSKIFDEINPELSLLWKEIKERLELEYS